jgi:hypothetical protein
MKEDRAAFFGGFSKNFHGVSPISHPVSAELLRWGRSVAMQVIL